MTGSRLPDGRGRAITTRTSVPAELVDDAESQDDGYDPADTDLFPPGRRMADALPETEPEAPVVGRRMAPVEQSVQSFQPQAVPQRPQLQPQSGAAARKQLTQQTDRMETVKGTVHAELLKQLGPTLYAADLDQQELDKRVRAVLADVLALAGPTAEQQRPDPDHPGDQRRHPRLRPDRAPPP